MPDWDSMSVSKKRQLTKLLRAVGDAPTQDGRSHGEVMAALVWQLACTGSVCFPDGRELKASVKDWKDAVQWIYTHCDGAARVDQAIALGLEGQLADTPLSELQRLVSDTMAVLGKAGDAETTEEEEDS